MPLMASVPPLFARSVSKMGRERLAPTAQGPSETGDLGDRGRVERSEDLLGASTPSRDVLRTHAEAPWPHS